MTTYYLIRHAEPEWRSSDSVPTGGLRREFCPLSIKGVRQAKELIGDARLQGAQVIVSSPYTRALHTAAILSRGLNLPLEVEFDLYEWVPDYAAAALHDAAAEPFSPCRRRAPQRENMRDELVSEVAERTVSVLRRFSAHSEVIVLCHGGVIEAATGKVGVRYGGIVVLSL